MSYVTVLLSVFNGEKYLSYAIESILRQTFTDFEFLIIDDGSFDNTINIIDSFKDDRIRLIRNSENYGLTKSLNKGIVLSNGKYIARIDADDISLPTRLEKQVAFMDKNPDVGICGSWFQYINKDIIKKHPTEHEDIKTALFENNAIGHPTAIFRKNIITNFNLFYNETFTAAQDYELWVRASQVTKLANIPEVLVQYRSHNKQVSVVNRKVQTYYAIQAKIPLIIDLTDNSISKTEFKLYESLLAESKKYSYKEISMLLKLLNSFIQKNEEKCTFKSSMLFEITFGQFHKLCHKIANPNVKSFLLLRYSIFYKYLTLKFRLRLFLKSILGSMGLYR